MSSAEKTTPRFGGHDANEICQFPLTFLFRVGQECALLSSAEPLHTPEEGGGAVAQSNVSLAFLVQIQTFRDRPV